MSKIIFVLVLFPSLSFAQPFIFSRNVSYQDKVKIAGDFKMDMSLKDDPKLERIMGVSDLSDNTLRNWISERLHYLLSADEVIADKVVELGEYDYSNPEVLPAETADMKFGLDPIKNSPGDMVTVASNVGTELYLKGKLNRTLIGLNFPLENSTTALLKFTSPRVGVARLANEFYTLPDPSHPSSMVNSWFRISVLFSMARHTDGNGRSLGFLHSKCPEGTAYGGVDACDSNINGPLGLEGYMYLGVRSTCLERKTCTAKEAELLVALAADSFSRLLDKTFADPSPEGNL